MQYSLLVGIVPPERKLAVKVQECVTDIEGSPILWLQAETDIVEDQDDGGTPTLLVQAITEAPSEAILEAIQTELHNCRDDILNSEGHPQQQTNKCEMWATAPAPLPLRPSNGYESKLSMVHGDIVNSSRVLKEWGIIELTKILGPTQTQELSLLVEEAIATAEASLALNRPEIVVGRDAFIFREMASRNLERFDLRLSVDSDCGRFVTRHIVQQPHIQQLLKQTMEDEQSDADIDTVTDTNFDFDLSVVYSRPGACAQGWHADGKHQQGTKDAGWERLGWKNQLARPYAICLFLPLINLNDEVGFTQFWPGSHRHRDLVGFGKVAEIAQATLDGKCNAGDGILYDYRLLHRGMPNKSSQIRPVVQVVFKKKWYIETANYGNESIIAAASKEKDDKHRTH